MPLLSVTAVAAGEVEVMFGREANALMPGRRHWLKAIIASRYPSQFSSKRWHSRQPIHAGSRFQIHSAI